MQDEDDKLPAQALDLSLETRNSRERWPCGLSHAVIEQYIKFYVCLQDEEDELLAQALDLSLEQEQRRTGKPGSRPRRPAGCTRTRDHYVPKSLAGMSEE